MSYAEEVLKIRKLINEAVRGGVVGEDNQNIYEATLLQIMNEAERHRQEYLAQAEMLRKQAERAEGQASAFSAMSSVIYSVINGYVLLNEKAKREELSREEEIIEKQKAMAEAIENEKLDKKSKKTK